MPPGTLAHVCCHSGGIGCYGPVVGRDQGRCSAPCSAQDSRTARNDAVSSISGLRNCFKPGRLEASGAVSKPGGRLPFCGQEAREGQSWALLSTRGGAPHSQAATSEAPGSRECVCCAGWGRLQAQPLTCCLSLCLSGRYKDGTDSPSEDSEKPRVLYSLEFTFDADARVAITIYCQAVEEFLNGTVV